jgi:hypothetical protein
MLTSALDFIRTALAQDARFSCALSRARIAFADGNTTRAISMFKRTVPVLARTAFTAIVLGCLASPGIAQGEVNIYSYRQPQLINPLLEAFTKKTGIKANVVYAAAGLNERLAAEARTARLISSSRSTPAAFRKRRMRA